MEGRKSVVQRRCVSSKEATAIAYMNTHRLVRVIRSASSVMGKPFKLRAV